MEGALGKLIGLEIVTSGAVPKGKILIHPETYGGHVEPAPPCPGCAELEEKAARLTGQLFLAEENTKKYLELYQEKEARLAAVWGIWDLWHKMGCKKDDNRIIDITNILKPDTALAETKGEK